MWPLLTSEDFWPQTKTMGINFYIRVLHIKCGLNRSFQAILFTRFPVFDICWPQITFDPIHKKWGWCTIYIVPTWQKMNRLFTRFSIFDLEWPLTSSKYNRHNLLSMVFYQVWTQSEFPLSSYAVSSIWHLLASDDFWPQPQTIWIMYYLQWSYVASMNSKASLIKFGCLQSFQ